MIIADTGFFLVLTRYVNAIKLRKTSSLRQGLPQSRSHGWHTLKHIPVTGFQHPCWNDAPNLMALTQREGTGHFHTYRWKNHQPFNNLLEGVL